MEKQFLDKLGLEELMKETIALDCEGDAIRIDIEDHHKVFNVKFDDKTIIATREEGLTLPLDYETIYLSSEGTLKARPEPLADGEATHAFYNSEGHEQVDVLVDGMTIVIGSDGTLQATFQKASAAKPVEVASDGTISLNYDNKTLVLDSEDNLSANIDNSTIIINSEGLIVVNIDNDTIILDSEGRLSSGSVYPDNKTIVKDANKLISVPIDYDTITIASDGSGYIVSPRSLINGVELKGDKNTEEIKVTWFGTKEEYEALKNAGLINPHTLYVINTSEGYIPSTPNYNNLSNKPQINHVELSGDKTLAEFGIQPAITNGTAIDFTNNTVGLRYHAGVLTVNTSNELFANTYNVDQIDNMIGSMRTLKVVSVKPTDPSANTMYYVETATPSLYDIYLYDSDKNEIYLGTSEVGTYTAGTAIDIDTFNVISIKRDLSVTSSADDTKVPTTKAVYDFVFQGASSTADGDRGIVPQPVAGDENKLLAGNGLWVSSFTGASATAKGTSGPVPEPAMGDEKSVLRGDATWTKIVDDCVTDADDQVLSAAQGKYLEDRLGTDADWTKLTTNSYVQSGSVYYKVKNRVVEIRIDQLMTTSPVNVEIGNVPTAIKPDALALTATIALNNNNAQAAFTIDTNGAMKIYSRTGQYAYTGTLVYTL